MHALYTFDFLNTISEQLSAKLVLLPVTPLNLDTLTELGEFQTTNDVRQGVYLLYISDEPVYLGKADDLRVRLQQHLSKLSGRQNIDLNKAGYKCLLLDKSMSTAANETVLLTLFQRDHHEMWNNRGFGPKDPGRQRDNTCPSHFDTLYPINDRYPVTVREPQTTVGELLATMKAQLPYTTFRYKLLGHSGLVIDASTVPPNARDLLHAVVRQLGAGWKGVVLANGMILYRTDQSYEYGEELLP